MKKKLLRILFLIIMFFGIVPATSFSNTNDDVHEVHAAVNHTGGYVYFLKPSTWTESTVMMFIGHDSYTSVYTMNKVSNTDNLYRYTMPSWGGATYVAFANASSVWGSGNWGPSNRTNATHYTNVYNDYRFDSGSYYVCVPASTSNNAGITINYKGSASDLNLTTTANVYGANIGTKNYSEYASSGTVKVSGYYMSAYNTASSRSAVSSTSSTAYASATLAPGSTATFTATPNTGYEFIGWSTSSTEANIVSTNATYNFKYDISYTGKTLYALFKQSEKKVVTFYADLSYIKANWSGDIDRPFIHYWSSSKQNAPGDFGTLTMENVYENLYKYEIPLGPNMIDIEGINFGLYQNNEMKQTEGIKFNEKIKISDSGKEYRIIIEHNLTWEENVVNPKITSGISVDEVIPVYYYDNDVSNEYVCVDKIYGYDFKPRMLPKEGYKLNGWHTSNNLEVSSRFEKNTFEANCADSYALYANYENTNDYYIYVESLNLPWESFSVYMWSDYFGDEYGNNTTHKNAIWPGSTDNVTSLGNNMYKILIDSSQSFDHLIFCDSADKAPIKQTIDLDLTPDKNYYIFTETETKNHNNKDCYDVKYEEQTDNFLHAQKNVSSDVNDFRFIAGFKNQTEAKAIGGANADLSTKQFGFKFIFVKESTSFVGYWNFTKGHKYDVIRYDGKLYESKDSTGMDPESEDFLTSYSEYYALSLTDDITFKYSDYDQIIVVACYKDADGDVQVIKAQEYNIVGTSDNVYLYELER